MDSAMRRYVDKLDSFGKTGLRIDCRDGKKLVELSCDFSVYADADEAVIDGSETKATIGFPRNYSKRSHPKLFPGLANKVMNYIKEEKYNNNLKVKIKLIKEKIKIY